FLYSFSATASNLLNDQGPGADYKSHSGNYEVALRGVVTPPESVPEPSVVFGLIGLGGLLAAKRKQQQAG
ncbi:MAG: NF038130 family PEP-CTERM protein, partial [Phormidium sp.]